MSKITATKYVSIDTLSELLNAIKTYGKENVSTDNMYEFFRAAVSSSVNTSEWYELIEIANDKIVASTITEVFAHIHFREPFASAFGVSEEEFVNRLINIALERNLSLGRLPPCTTLEHLNELAARNLAPLYYVEVVQSIDVAFVRKYAEDLDLEAVARRTENEDVREVAKELYYN